MGKYTSPMDLMGIEYQMQIDFAGTIGARSGEARLLVLNLAMKGSPPHNRLPPRFPPGN